MGLNSYGNLLNRKLFWPSILVRLRKRIPIIGHHYLCSALLLQVYRQYKAGFRRDWKASVIAWFDKSQKNLVAFRSTVPCRKTRLIQSKGRKIRKLRVLQYLKLSQRRHLRIQVPVDDELWINELRNARYSDRRWRALVDERDEIATVDSLPPDCQRRKPGYFLVRSTPSCSKYFCGVIHRLFKTAAQWPHQRRAKRFLVRVPVNLAWNSVPQSAW